MFNTKGNYFSLRVFIYVVSVNMGRSMTDCPQIGFNPYSMYQNWGYGYGYQYPAFRGVQSAPQPVNVSLQTPPDTVTFKTTEHIQAKPKKEGLSTGAKWGLGALALVGIGAIAYFATRGKAKINPSTLTHEQLEKLAAEKLKITELPAHIDFKEAKTLEEAIKYSKDVLKISNVDDNFSLEALNWVNRGLTDISNAHKGRAKMPNGLIMAETVLENFENKALGGVSYAGIHGGDIRNKEFGFLQIEKRFFENGYLDNILKNSLFDKGNKAYTIKNGKCVSSILFNESGSKLNFLDDDLAKLVEKYYNNPNGLTLKEKILIQRGITNKPTSIKMLGLDVLPKHTPEQKITLEKLGVIKGEQVLAEIYSPSYGLETVYHELGHLQDMTKNYVKAVKDKNIGLIRWDRKDQLTKEIIEQTPMLKDFFSETEQKTISKVSKYAQSGIGEFIAETYAKLVKGVKLDDDVMALYKKYGGPALS